uniref:Uncharacterized protein LOC114343021 n=1 Tax=Diabrotica virgifera virgifera TaxID=50390 RepID=A0A6P7GIB1_DIAVI
MDFNRQFWTELIELYRENSCLWNSTSKDYTNKWKRQASYEKLLEKLKAVNPTATLDNLKKKIGNMRTAFQREFKKVQASKETGTNTDDVYEPTLWYYDLMSFITQSDGDGKDSTLDENNLKLESYNSTVDSDDDHDDDGSDYEREYNVSPSSLLQSFSGLENPKIEILAESKADPLSSTNSCYTAKRQKKKLPKESSEIEAKKQRVLDLAYDALANDTNDEITENECTLAGKRIGYQLQRVEERQRIIAEKLISDVMFYARMGRLQENATVYCSNPSALNICNNSSSYQHPSNSLS